MIGNGETAAGDEREGDAGLSRREFLRSCGVGVCLLSAGVFSPVPGRAAGWGPQRGFTRPKRSPWFTPLEGRVVRCELCPRRCVVRPGGRGFCRVRENRDGTYYSLVWGNPCAVHLDPIEKKPLFHVLPSSRSYSLATAGCNLECKFCQNWEISQATPEDLLNHDMPPETIVEQALRSGARSIAYTYVEPTVFYEYMTDVARLARTEGLLNVCHSNAFINPEPLKELCGLLDAANFDLKGFSEAYYRDLCSGQLAPVLESLRICRREGVHLELTNLVVPTKNEEEEMIRRMCRWIRGELGPDTPLHFSRFYPLYKLRNLPPTPVRTLERARAAARAEGLNYVYIGNVPGHEGEHTFCPGCGKLVIQRIGFMVGEVRLKDGACAACGYAIPGIWG